MEKPDEGAVDSLFLVAYDYGMGGLWATMYAPSQEAIRRKYPELSVVTQTPQWLTPDAYDRLRSEPLWLDDPPTGILDALMAARGPKS